MQTDIFDFVESRLLMLLICCLMYFPLFVGVLCLSLLCPRHDNGRGIKWYPCPSVCTYVCNYVRLSQQRPLSNLNIFHQNFMTLGHIVKYHDVFFKFDNGPFCTRLSRVMALCLWNFTVLNDVGSLTRTFFIRILWNLVTLFSTMMSSSSLIMVHIAPGFEELWPFVYENSPF